MVLEDEDQSGIMCFGLFKDKSVSAKLRPLWPSGQATDMISVIFFEWTWVRFPKKVII